MTILRFLSRREVMLIGGFEALRLLSLPDAAAYAIMGALALVGGVAAVLGAGARNRSMHIAISTCPPIGLAGIAAS